MHAVIISDQGHCVFNLNFVVELQGSKRSQVLWAYVDIYTSGKKAIGPGL
jgi:hypothetical protein